MEMHIKIWNTITISRPYAYLDAIKLYCDRTVFRRIKFKIVGIFVCVCGSGCLQSFYTQHKNKILNNYALRKSQRTHRCGAMLPKIVERNWFNWAFRLLNQQHNIVRFVSWKECWQTFARNALPLLWLHAQAHKSRQQNKLKDPQIEFVLNDENWLRLYAGKERERERGKDDKWWPKHRDTKA